MNLLRFAPEALREFKWHLLLDARTVFRRRTVFAFSLIFVLIVFADVVFKRASLSMLDNQNITGVTREYTSLYPEKYWRLPYMGYYDAGGAGFQSEPAQFFMKHAIYDGESPYWDPYTSAGSFGPELLVDLKFSPFTILTAIGGAGSKAFHLVALLLYTFAVFFMFRLANEILKLSPAAAISGCLVYLLSGYFTANLNSNVTQVYLYLPMTLYLLLSLNRSQASKASARYLALSALAIACIFLCTFIPTTSLSLTFLFLVASADAIFYSRHSSERLRRIGLVGVAFAVGFLLVAFLYLPIVEVLKFTKGLESYGARVFYPANWQSIISFFTSKHIGESYNAGAPTFLQFQENVIFHFGMIASMIGLCAFTDRRLFKNPVFLAIAFLFLATLSRVFAVPVLSAIVEFAPFFKNVGQQYWWVVVGFSMPLIVAFGFESFLSQRPSPWMATGIAVFIVASCALVYFKIGLPGEVAGYVQRGDAIGYLRIGLAILVTGVTLVWLINRKYLARPLSDKIIVRCVVALLILMFFEFTFEMNHVRFKRMDLTQAPDYVVFLKENLAEHRIANFGFHGVPAQMGAGFQIPQLESYAMHLTPDYADLCNRAITNEVIGTGSVAFCTTRADSKGVHVNHAVLDMMSVKYFVVSKYMPKYVEYFDEKKLKVAFETPAVKIYENPAPLPRFFAVSSLRKDDLTPEVHALDAHGTAVTLDEYLLDQAKTAGISTENTNGTMIAVGKIQEYHHAHVTAEIEMSAPGVVVLMDNWHPSWNATVDGQPAYVGKINQSFRGIVVPAGKHKIEMSYRPKTLSAGLGLGAIGFLILLTSGFWIQFIDKQLGRRKK
jgi:hypothetical protein